MSTPMRGEFRRIPGAAFPSHVATGPGERGPGANPDTAGASTAEPSDPARGEAASVLVAGRRTLAAGCAGAAGRRGRRRTDEPFLYLSPYALIFFFLPLLGYLYCMFSYLFSLLYLSLSLTVQSG